MGQSLGDDTSPSFTRPHRVPYEITTPLAGVYFDVKHLPSFVGSDTINFVQSRRIGICRLKIVRKSRTREGRGL